MTSVPKLIELKTVLIFLGPLPCPHVSRAPMLDVEGKIAHDLDVSTLICNSEIIHFMGQTKIIKAKIYKK